MRYQLSKHNQLTTGTQLIQAIKTIPIGVTSLDLDGDLDNKTGAELAQAFAALPLSVTYLNLYRDRLGNKSGAELAQAFGAIPPGVTRLSLASNLLGSKSGSELAQVLAAIPASVTHLGLNCNDLCSKSGAELEQAFAAIPASVSHLDLGGNGLGSKRGDELMQAFAAIPPTVTHLDLNCNDGLGSKRGIELVQALKALPLGVTHLNLSDNVLGSKTGSKLAQTFAAIPASVVHLDLSSNALCYQSCAELALIFAAFPASIKTIYLRYNDLFTKKTNAQINEILMALGNERARFILTNNGESDLARAWAPMVELSLQRNLPLDLAAYILAFLPTDRIGPHAHSFYVQKLEGTKKKMEELLCVRKKTTDTTLASSQRHEMPQDSGSSWQMDTNNKSKGLPIEIDVKIIKQDLSKTLNEKLTAVSLNQATLKQTRLRQRINTIIDKHLEVFEKKANYFAKQGGACANALKTTNTLIDSIREAKNSFNQDNEELLQSAEKRLLTICNNSINAASGVLKQHRGFKEAFAQFLSALVSVLSLGIVNYTTGSTFFSLFPVATDSFERLNDFKMDLKF